MPLDFVMSERASLANNPSQVFVMYLCICVSVVFCFVHFNEVFVKAFPSMWKVAINYFYFLLSVVVLFQEAVKRVLVLLFSGNLKQF